MFGSERLAVAEALADAPVVAPVFAAAAVLPAAPVALVSLRPFSLFWPQAARRQTPAMTTTPATRLNMRIPRVGGGDRDATSRANGLGANSRSFSCKNCSEIASA